MRMIELTMAVPCRSGAVLSRGDQAAADIPLSATAVRPPGTCRYNVEGLHMVGVAPHGAGKDRPNLHTDHAATMSYSRRTGRRRLRRCSTHGGRQMVYGNCGGAGRS